MQAMALNFSRSFIVLESQNLRNSMYRNSLLNIGRKSMKVTFISTQ